MPILQTLLLSLFISAMPLTAIAAIPSMAMNSEFTLKVNNKDETMRLLVEKCEALGGYFIIYADKTLTLNVPQQKARDYITYAESLGKILTRKHQSDDIHTALQIKQSTLKSKHAMLKKYMQVLAAADVGSVATVEQAVTHLVYDIEKLSGEIKLMQHRLAFAKITFNFQFKNRNTPVSNQPSSFPWLNTMKLQRLLEQF
jgi:hypothetical protein